MELEIARKRAKTDVSPWRPTAIAAIGPVTALVGVVWAVAQPYRLTLLNDDRTGLWDHLAQPPLLVIAVAVCFELLVARPLLRTLGEAP